MFFVNMLDDKGKGEFKRLFVKGNTGCKFVNTVSDEEIAEGAGLALDGDSIRVVSSSVDGYDKLSGVFKDPLGECKPADIEDSEENPLIWVLTDEVSFLHGSSNLFKLISINQDMFLFCLVKGICGVGEDKTILMRSIPPVTEREMITYKAKDLYSSCSAIDKESGYNMTFDKVNCMRITISRDASSISSKTFPDLSVTISEEGCQKERERKAEAKKRAEERRKAQAEERRLAEERAKRMREQEEHDSDMSVPPVHNTKVRNSKEHFYAEPKSRKEVCTGAAAFLALVNKKKQEG